MIRSALVVAFTVTLPGCVLFTLFEPTLPPLSSDLQVIAATDVWSIATDARYPTDVAGLAGGGFGVLDGYQHRTKLFDGERAFLVDVPLTNDFGPPARASRASGGDSWWLTVPAADGVLRVAPSGEVLQSFRLTLADGAVLPGPVAIVDQGDHIVVGLHDGSIVFADPQSGVVRERFTTDPDGGALGAITDITSDNAGRLLVTDAFSSRVVLLEPDGTATNAFGRFGLWAGWLAKPKAVAPGPDGTVLVADSLLRAVQMFDPDGTFLGVIADSDGKPLPLEHPIALEAQDDGSFLLLDTRTAVVWGFSIDPDTIVAAREAAGAFRFLRTPLADLSQDAQLASGALCFHCHDGTIEDDRYVWDPEMGHHPVDIVPLEEIPPFFPLVDGKIACTTCHSPHGTVGGTTAATATAEETTALVRHAPTTVEDLFTRVSRTDSALCEACHSGAAHATVLEQAGGLGSAHPAGKELEEALAKRGEAALAGLPDGVDGGCLTCHAVHGATDEGLRRGADDAATCLACHGEKGVAQQNHPLHRSVGQEARIARAGLMLDSLGENTCRTCHDLVGGRGSALLARPETGGSLCATCHGPIRLAGSHVNVKGDQGLPCLGCHAVHDGPGDHHLLTTLDNATAADPQGCLECHAPGGSGALGSARPGRDGHPVDDETTCASCHDPHAPDEAPACSTCHEEQHAAEERGGHGRAECLDCHPAHTPAPSLQTRLIPPGSDFNPVDRRCLACHATGATLDGPKVFAWGHPAPVFTPGGARWTPLAGLPLFAEDGSRLAAGENGGMTCSTCHETHGPDATKPGDNLRRPGWEEVCGSCHGDQALVLYRYFHDPSARSRMGVAP